MCSNAYKFFLSFKTALYFSTLLLTVVQREIISVKLKGSLLLNTLLHICPLTFIIKVPQLSGNPSVASIASSQSSLQVFTTYCIYKAMHIHFIDSKCHIKQLKAGKSGRSCLTNHIRIMPLVINALEADTDTDTHQCANQSNFKKSSAHWATHPLLIGSLKFQKYHIIKIQRKQVLIELMETEQVTENSTTFTDSVIPATPKNKN